MVRVPNRIAKDYGPGRNDRRLAFILSSGSPVRYYLPGVPVVIVSTICIARRVEVAKRPSVACLPRVERASGVAAKND